MPASSQPLRHDFAVLAAVCLAALILPLSFSAGAMATPAIGRDLGGDATMLMWITNAFMLTFGGLLMVAGAMADRIGRKCVFQSGIALFALASFALAGAPSTLVIDLLRGVQGVGAAAALSGGSAGLAQAFAGQARTRAFSLLGTTFGVGLAFGPILAGMLIQSLGWRAIFLATGLIATSAFLLGRVWMRETKAPGTSVLDWPGAASFTTALSLFTFAVIQAPIHGWVSAVTLCAFGLSLASLIAFCWIETHTAAPMLDLTLFRYPRFVGVQLLPIATCYGFVVLLVLLPLRFIGIEGRSEMATGLLMLAISGPMVIVPSIAAALTRWFSAGVISGCGLLMAAAGLLWLGQIAPGGNPFWAMLVIGLGTALPWGLMDSLSVSVVPVERAGMAAGIFGTTRVAGEGLALAMVGAVLAWLIQREIASALPHVAVTAMAGSRLAMGDLAQASLLLPDMAQAQLAQAYMSGFATLTHGLAVITGLSAMASFGLLAGAGAGEAHENQPDLQDAVLE